MGLTAPGSVAGWLAAATLALAAGCAPKERAVSVLTPGKVGMVVVGRSSRAEVFAALGRPGHTERSTAGESWVYDEKVAGTSDGGIAGQVAAASGVVGAFVPYVGLVGSGIGLAGASGVSVGGAAVPASTSSLRVDFTPDGLVRDCVYSSTGIPAGLPGAEAGSRVDCQRPPPVIPRP